ncbi:MAG: DUF427 domain-containing protein, partial [Actinomycetota bacterium]
MTDVSPSSTDSPVRSEANHRWVRARVGNQQVIDTTDARYVWEHRYYPQWYIPVGDVNAEIVPTGQTTATERGEAHSVDLLLAGDTRISDAGWIHPDSPLAELRDRIRLRWEAMDQWFEEDIEVFVHPRSPYTRVDVLPSSRHVVIAIDGTVVADSTSPSILYETGLPARFYLPPDDVRTDLLVPTDTSSACPYKGVARYWSVTIDGTTHADVAWGYDTPLPES